MKFKVGFEATDKKKLFSLWEKILKNNVWSHGKYVKKFEEKWSIHNSLNSLSFSSWSGAAQSVIEFYNLKNKTILCPSNTFVATPMLSKKMGCNVKFVDCNKYDLCISFEDLKKKVKKYKPKAIWVVHIGGHISFEIFKIYKFCKKNNIILIEDCAHSHGASFKNLKPGQWGDAGIYSLYATKTITTGEGGILVSKHKSLIEFAKQFRNYGKPKYKYLGLNYRMSEFSAALGCVQIDRLKDIVEWKNNYASIKLDKIYLNRIKFPENMISGYYKYIVFEKIKNSTGKVYEKGSHKIFNDKTNLPNTDWVNKNHWCVPIYYKGKKL